MSITVTLPKKDFDDLIEIKNAMIDEKLTVIFNYHNKYVDQTNKQIIVYTKDKIIKELEDENNNSLRLIEILRDSMSNSFKEIANMSIFEFIKWRRINKHNS